LFFWVWAPGFVREKWVLTGFCCLNTGPMGRRHSMRDFSQAPMLVLWEVTQACDLACRHCRASAQPHRDQGELSTLEAYRVMDQIRAVGDPIVVFTGGDPLKRPDIFNLIERSVGLGLR